MFFIPIIEVQKRTIPRKIIDTKNGKPKLIIDKAELRNRIPSGDFVNRDTGIKIQFVRISIDETVTKAMNDENRIIPIEARLSALYQMREIIENAICFDSQISEYHRKTSKNKSPHTLFIHKLYGVTSYDNDLFLVNLSVEEMYKKVVDNEMNGTHNKLYSLRDIKITPVELSGLKARASLQVADKVTPSGVTNISIHNFIKSSRLLIKIFLKNLSLLVEQNG